jgi:copper chaperone CopZ
MKDYPMIPSSSPAASSPSARVYAVAGMSCQHCVLSVTEEVLAVDGVEGVSVDLDTGALKVGGEQFSDEAVKAAVAEAGYEVIS